MKTIVIITSLIILLIVLFGFAYRFRHYILAASTVTPTIIERLDDPTPTATPTATAPAATTNESNKKCPDCICTSNDVELKSLTTEVRYLKWMTRLLGALMRRENAMNRVMSEHCKGTFAMVPLVQKSDQETQYVQNFIQKDPEMLNYFQTHFTQYSGIESKPYQEII
jgi:hypothetical protein